MVSRKQLPKKEPAKKKSDTYWKTKKKLNGKGKKLFTQVIFHDWCKACGLCIAFCPKEVFGRNQNDHPVIERPDDCIGCRFCEHHCPDFAITIQERYPDRRGKDNER